jgi:hypothetical protein
MAQRVTLQGDRVTTRNYYRRVTTRNYYRKATTYALLTLEQVGGAFTRSSSAGECHNAPVPTTPTIQEATPSTMRKRMSCLKYIQTHDRTLIIARVMGHRNRKTVRPSSIQFTVVVKNAQQPCFKGDMEMTAAQTRFNALIHQQSSQSSQPCEVAAYQPGIHMVKCNAVGRQPFKYTGTVRAIPAALWTS